MLKNNKRYYKVKGKSVSTSIDAADFAGLKKDGKTFCGGELSLSKIGSTLYASVGYVLKDKWGHYFTYSLSFTCDLNGNSQRVVCSSR